MSEECTHDCSSCSSNCSSKSLKKAPHELSKIKKVIAVVSGKGGVGKSMTCAMLAVNAQRRGLKAAIMDADITGPSIPKMFNLNGKKADANDLGFFPVRTKTDIEVMSMNVLLDEATDPVIWRGPVIAGVVTQFWTDVIWYDTDIMFIDCPPGTGDVPLTLFQSLPIDGIVVVTTPQSLVEDIVEKAIKMAEKMNISVLGIVENMSYIECPDCKKRIELFGESKVDALADKFKVDTACKIPLSQDLTKCADKGLIELYEGDYLDKLSDKIENL